MRSNVFRPAHAVVRAMESTALSGTRRDRKASKMTAKAATNVVAMTSGIAA